MNLETRKIYMNKIQETVLQSILVIVDFTKPKCETNDPETFVL